MTPIMQKAQIRFIDKHFRSLICSYMESKLLLFYPVMIGFWALCLVLDLIFLPFTGLRIAWPICMAYYAMRWHDAKEWQDKLDE